MQEGRIALVVTLAASLAGCDLQLDEPPPEVGSLAFKLRLPSGLDVDLIDYTLTGPEAFMRAGSINIDGAGSSFNLAIDDIPAGVGYMLELSGLEFDGTTVCIGSSTFDVEPDKETAVSLRLQCPGRKREAAPGRAWVDGEVNVCALVDRASATLSEDRTSFTLFAEASDQDDWPAPLEYSWSVSAGTLSESDQPEAVLACPSSGGNVTVTFVATDTECGDDATLNVFCPRAEELSSEAVAYQINAEHSGMQPNDTLRLPLSPRWRRDFGSPGISYPLVAMGRVIVTVANQREPGARLYALDAKTGEVSWGPAALAGTSGWANAAYDVGKVFALNRDGLLVAFDVLTGAQLWTADLRNQEGFSAPPTAYAGRVYVGAAGSGATVFAVEAQSGAVAWTASVPDGQWSSPAVSSTGVYLSYACNQAYGFAPESGSLLWRYAGGCTGGGGHTFALIDDSLYTRDTSGNLILDAVSGKVLGTHGSRAIPAGGSGALFTTEDGRLVARARGAATPSWTFNDGEPAMAPIVVGGHVVTAAASGKISVITALTGSVESTYDLRAPIRAADERDATAPLPGLAAGGHQLYVAAGTALVAF